MKKTELPPYGLLAEFSTPQQLLHAAEKAHAAGYIHSEAYAPYPVPGLEEAMHLKKTKTAWLFLIGGALGGLTGFLMQVYSCVFSYPVNVGGRPLYSWPAFIPITFELTVLGAGLTGGLGMLALNGLPQPYHPVFNCPAFDLASQDRFFLCIETKDPKFHAEHTRDFLTSLQPTGIFEVPA